MEADVLLGEAVGDDLRCRRCGSSTRGGGRGTRARTRPDSTSGPRFWNAAIDSATACGALLRARRARATRSSQAASFEPAGGGKPLHLRRRRRTGRRDRSPQPKASPLKYGAVAELRARARRCTPAICSPARAIDLLGELALGAAEDADLGERPVDRLVVGVADLLDHAHAGALRGRRRQQWRASASGPRCTRG